MYAVIVRGDIVDICEEPWYIKRHYDNDNPDLFWWVHADSYEDAEAVAVRGTKYNLAMKEPVLEDTEEAVITDKPTGSFVYDNREKGLKTEAHLAETKESVEDALCDLDLSAEERIAALEDVICELDTLIQEAK